MSFVDDLNQMNMLDSEVASTFEYEVQNRVRAIHRDHLKDPRVPKRYCGYAWGRWGYHGLSNSVSFEDELHNGYYVLSNKVIDGDADNLYLKCYDRYEEANGYAQQFRSILRKLGFTNFQVEVYKVYEKKRQRPKNRFMRAQSVYHETHILWVNVEW